MLQRLIKEPLVHFAIAGIAIFGLFALLDDTPEPVAPNQIVVSVADAQWLVDQYEATWRRPPRPDELDALIDEFIKEEMLVREALALGLDQNDTIVRRRLRQKMEFLSEASAASATPDDSVLVDFLQENQNAFARPPRVAFEQILLNDGDSPEVVLTELSAGSDPASLGARTLLPQVVPISTLNAIDSTFGRGFFTQVASLPTGDWQGPVTSSFGAHLVRISALEVSQVPPFEDIRDRVELEWRTSEAQAQRTRFLERLAAEYEVTRPDPSEVLE